MKQSRIQSMLVLGAALSLAGGLGFGAPTAAGRITLGDDKTRYTWKNKIRPPRVERALANEIAAWNKAVDDKKAPKRKARRLAKIREHAIRRANDRFDLA